MKKLQIDPLTLTNEQRDKLDAYNAQQKQLQTLQDIADIVQELLIGQDDSKKTDKKTISDMGALLMDIRESLKSLESKEDPESPDVAKPIVEAVGKLEKALKAIEVKPEVKVTTPDIKVPALDLKEFNQLLRSEIPKAFEKAIKTIPKVEMPAADNQPLLDAWEGISEQLVSIENATRMKPLPGSMASTQGGEWNVGTALVSGPLVGQTTASTTAVRLYGGTIPVTNGIFVQGLSTNTVSVFVGGSNVTTSTGYELQAGQCIPFTVDDIRDLFVISASGTPAVCWSVA